MAGYTPLFGSVFQGSLCGKFPDLPLWLVLLALADKNGEIDCHPSYIAMVSGIPVERVTECLEHFCQPDPSSRTPTDDGRRLKPLEGRGFGWKVINHGKYREKARLEAKNASEVESGKNRERMAHRKTAADRRSPPLTDPSYADADAYTDPSSLRSSSSFTESSSSSEGVQGEAGRSKDRGKEAKKPALQAAVSAVAESKRA